MKQVEWRWSFQLASLLILVVVDIAVAEQVTSEATDINSTLMSYYCSGYKGVNEKYFLSNLNTTLSNIRHQLTTGGFATAHTLINGEPVWGVAKCRGYLSVADCLNCFDFAVNQLKVCDVANGATAAYSDCELRYDNYNFYIEADYRVNYVVCSNTTSPQPIEFRKAAEKLLLDLQFVVPKISNLYAVSTRQVGDGVYAIAQCNLNINPSVCSECLRSRLSFFYGCLPATSGQALYNECYMRYSRTPFFGQNQTTHISSLLSHGDSSKKRSIIGGVVGGISFVLLVLAYFLFGKCKKTGGDRQDTLDAPELKGTINYKHLQLATNNFSEENMIGKGGFGEVFKAILDDNKVVAVKKLKATYTGLKTGFANEILLISHICHRNLVGLLGWSSDESHLLLVLEYMPNGSLDRFLWGEKRVETTM